jgi:hypothetical protein
LELLVRTVGRSFSRGLFFDADAGRKFKAKSSETIHVKATTTASRELACCRREIRASVLSDRAGNSRAKALVISLTPQLALITCSMNVDKVSTTRE